MSKHLRTGLVLIFPVFAALQGQCQQLDSIRVVAPGATVQQVSSQFRFTEGPAVNKRGDIYFTDQPNDKI
jgi:gluconolactonase